MTKGTTTTTATANLAETFRRLANAQRILARVRRPSQTTEVRS